MMAAPTQAFTHTSHPLHVVTVPASWPQGAATRAVVAQSHQGGTLATDPSQ